MYLARVVTEFLSSNRMYSFIVLLTHLPQLPLAFCIFEHLARKQAQNSTYQLVSSKMAGKNEYGGQSN